MANTLVHRTEIEESVTVETVGDLLEALAKLTGTEGAEMQLTRTYVVSLVAETLSDRSVAHSIQLREAEAA